MTGNRKGSASRSGSDPHAGAEEGAWSDRAADWRQDAAQSLVGGFSTHQQEQDHDERVGYARPPRANRFRPGQSGNPRGRPKGARNLATLVAAALGERVAINENGKRRRISKMEAMVKQLVNRAASGEARATQLLLALVQSQEAEHRAASALADAEKLNEADVFVMAELARRIGARPET